MTKENLNAVTKLINHYLSFYQFSVYETRFLQQVLSRISSLVQKERDWLKHSQLENFHHGLDDKLPTQCDEIEESLQAHTAGLVYAFTQLYKLHEDILFNLELSRDEYFRTVLKKSLTIITTLLHHLSHRFNIDELESYNDSSDPKYHVDILSSRAEKMFFYNNHMVRLISCLGGTYLPYSQAFDPFIGIADGHCTGITTLWGEEINQKGYITFPTRIGYDTYIAQSKRVINTFKKMLKYHDPVFSAHYTFKTDLKEIVNAFIDKLNPKYCYNLSISLDGTAHTTLIRSFTNSDFIEFAEPNHGIVLLKKDMMKKWLASTLCDAKKLMKNGGCIRLIVNNTQPENAKPSFPFEPRSVTASVNLLSDLETLLSQTNDFSIATLSSIPQLSCQLANTQWHPKSFFNKKLFSKLAAFDFLQAIPLSHRSQDSCSAIDALINERMNRPSLFGDNVINNAKINWPTAQQELKDKVLIEIQAQIKQCLPFDVLKVEALQQLVNEIQHASMSTMLETVIQHWQHRLLSNGERIFDSPSGQGLKEFSQHLIKHYEISSYRLHLLYELLLREIYELASIHQLQSLLDCYAQEAKQPTSSLCQLLWRLKTAANNERFFHSGPYKDVFKQLQPANPNVLLIVYQTMLTANKVYANKTKPNSATAFLHCFGGLFSSKEKDVEQPASILIDPPSQRL